MPMRTGGGGGGIPLSPEEEALLAQQMAAAEAPPPVPDGMATVPPAGLGGTFLQGASVPAPAPPPPPPEEYIPPGAAEAPAEYNYTAPSEEPPPAAPAGPSQDVYRGAGEFQYDPALAAARQTPAAEFSYDPAAIPEAPPRVVPWTDESFAAAARGNQSLPPLTMTNNEARRPTVTQGLAETGKMGTGFGQYFGDRMFNPAAALPEPPPDPPRRYNFAAAEPSLIDRTQPMPETAPAATPPMPAILTHQSPDVAASVAASSHPTLDFLLHENPEVAASAEVAPRLDVGLPVGSSQAEMAAASGPGFNWGGALDAAAGAQRGYREDVARITSGVSPQAISPPIGSRPTIPPSLTPRGPFLSRRQPMTSQTTGGSSAVRAPALPGEPETDGETRREEANMADLLPTKTPASPAVDARLRDLEGKGFVKNGTWTDDTLAESLAEGTFIEGANGPVWGQAAADMGYVHQSMVGKPANPRDIGQLDGAPPSDAPPPIVPPAASSPVPSTPASVAESTPDSSGTDSGSSWVEYGSSAGGSSGGRRRRSSGGGSSSDFGQRSDSFESEDWEDYVQDLDDDGEISVAEEKRARKLAAGAMKRNRGKKGTKLGKGRKRAPFPETGQSDIRAHILGELSANLGRPIGGWPEQRRQ